MSKLEKNLKLLQLLDKVNIDLQDDTYIISCKNYNYDYKEIIAVIKDKEISYRMSDLYNNSFNVEEIDFEQLNTLQEVVKLLMEN